MRDDRLVDAMNGGAIGRRKVRRFRCTVCSHRMQTENSSAVCPNDGSALVAAEPASR